MLHCETPDDRSEDDPPDPEPPGDEK